jgi:hypothetical protein
MLKSSDLRYAQNLYSRHSNLNRDIEIVKELISGANWDNVSAEYSLARKTLKNLLDRIICTALWHARYCSVNHPFTVDKCGHAYTSKTGKPELVIGKLTIKDLQKERDFIVDQLHSVKVVVDEYCKVRDKKS